MPRYWKSYRDLEIGGPSYSIVSYKGGIFGDSKRYSESLGKLKRIDDGAKTVGYVFEKRTLKVPKEEAMRPKTKRFIKNCPKGGYGSSKVRRYTRRRLSSK